MHPLDLLLSLSVSSTFSLFCRKNVVFCNHTLSKLYIVNTPEPGSEVSIDEELVQFERTSDTMWIEVKVQAKGLKSTVLCYSNYLLDWLFIRM